MSIFWIFYKNQFSNACQNILCVLPESCNYIFFFFFCMWIYMSIFIYAYINFLKILAHHGSKHILSESWSNINWQKYSFNYNKTCIWMDGANYSTACRAVKQSLYREAPQAFNVTLWFTTKNDKRSVLVCRVSDWKNMSGCTSKEN